MPLRWMLLGLCCALIAQSALAAEKLPYTAYVSGRNVYVRSGPGKDYYPTDKLQKGQKVEVFRHEPGGWFAIRPPEGSYSWVPARDLSNAEDKLADAKSDRVAVRIGSNLHRSRDVISVRLRRGETVEILGFDRSGSKTWCKIAPPAGEFRWIHGKFVSRRDQEVDGEPEQEPKAKEGKRKAEQQPTSAGRESDDDPDRIRLSSRTRGVERVASLLRKAKPAGNAAAPIETAKPKDTGSPRREPTDSGDTAEGDTLQAKLDAIDADLSAIVAADLKAWDLRDVTERTEALLAGARTSLERGRAQLLRHKIARFADLKARRDRLNGILTETQRKNLRLGDDRPLAPQPIDERYDGIGVLVPVISRREGAPPFALTDGRNDGVKGILMFVSAAPGVNLRAHVGQVVGLNGIRGIVAERGINRPHVTAKRVTVLRTASKR